jgi:hypothetical protein
VREVRREPAAGGDAVEGHADLRAAPVQLDGDTVGERQPGQAGGERQPASRPPLRLGQVHPVRAVAQEQVAVGEGELDRQRAGTQRAHPQPPDQIAGDRRQRRARFRGRGAVGGEHQLAAARAARERSRRRARARLLAADVCRQRTRSMKAAAAAGPDADAFGAAAQPGPHRVLHSKAPILDALLAPVTGKSIARGTLVQVTGHRVEGGAAYAEVADHGWVPLAYLEPVAPADD